jgi:hypothetical protein
MYENRRNYLSVVFPVLVIIGFFLFNVFTPSAIDDFAYRYNFANGEGITSIAGILESQRAHYFGQGGRSVAHFLAQIFLMFENKIFFDIANTFVYFIFITLIHVHIRASFSFKTWLFLAINIFLWIFIPARGQNFLWLTGSCNYLWTTMIVLLFLLPFRLKLEHKDFKMNGILSVLFFLLAVIAGWTNENSGAAILFMLIVYFAILKMRKKNDRQKLVTGGGAISLFEILGTIGFLAGYLILLLAPGNYVRLDSYEQNHAVFFVEMLERFIKISVFILQHTALPIGTCILIIWKLGSEGQKKNYGCIFFYGIGFLAGSYSLVMSPAHSGRAFLIVIVFLSILFFALLYSAKIELPSIILNNKAAIILVLLLSFFFNSVLPASRNIMSVYLRMKQRSEYIYQKKSEGILDITVKSPIPVHDKHVSIDGLDDIGTSNAAMVKYYGIHSLTGVLYNDDW